MTLIRLQNDLYIPEDFHEGNHYYFADDKGEKEYTGITTVLRTMAKPALIQWAANEACKYMAETAKTHLTDDGGIAFTNAEEFTRILEEARTAHSKKKEAAGTHGTNTHALVEQWILAHIKTLSGKPTSPTGHAYDSIMPFIDWAVDNVDHFLFAERPVHSKSLYLAGTIDFGCVMNDGSRRVGDLKTGSGIYYEAILQTEFYQLLAEEEGDEPYQGSVIVNMKKDGKFETQLRARNELDRNAALGLLAAYRGNASFVKPK